VQALIDRHPLRVAMEARDLHGVAEALAPDVVLHSPITASFRFVGRAAVNAHHAEAWVTLTWSTRNR